MLRQLAVLLALVSVALAALSLKTLEEKPEKFKDVEGCYIEDLGKVLPPGQSAPCPHHCMEYHCKGDIIQIATCVVAAPTPPCVLKEDHSKPYPDCCPQIKCP